MIYTPNGRVNLNISTLASEIVTWNVIADSKFGDANSIIVSGSHLDSVPAGPGINDNGSGSGLNLEIALQLATESLQKTLKNKVRFAWWGGEERGLLGSRFYVNNLTLAERSQIQLNLNFDMVGSPNFVRQVYNGTTDKNTNGSGIIQNLFNNYFDADRIRYEPSYIDAVNARSDYGPFMAINISVGGLATGADELKSPLQREAFGGIANAILDPCYHQSCDTTDNINQGVYLDMGKSAAHVLYTLATTENLRQFLQYSD